MLSYNFIILMLLIFLLLLIRIQPTTIFQTPIQFKCSGNFQSFEGRCIPCRYGTVALNGKCVALNLSFTYGSNIINKVDPDCQPNRFFFGVCLKCKTGFYLDSNSKCQNRALCEVFDLSRNECLKIMGEETSQIIDTPANNDSQVQNENSYALSKEQQIESIQTSYKSEKYELAPLTESNVPSLFIPINGTQQAETEKIIYFIHASEGQLKVSIDICDIPKEKKCSCSDYFYNEVSGKCIKVLNKLIIASNKEFQIVDPYCISWKVNEVSQKYECLECQNQYEIDKSKQKCLLKQGRCLDFSSENEKVCIKCRGNFILDNLGKCIV